MKKLLTALALPVLCLASVGSVSAASINNTGPGSNNQVRDNNTRNSNITCINNTNVKSNNNQSSNSGSANNSGNTNGGGASSGSSSNSNNSSTTVNGGCAPGTRPVAANSPEAKAAGGGVAPSVAPSGGRGAGAPAPQVDAQGRPLPATGVDDTIRAAGIAVAGLAGTAGLVAAGTGLYRRRALN